MLRRGIILALFVSGAIGASASSHGWKEFSSSKGFSVKYPARWFRQTISPDQLDILSTKGYRKAVVIEKGEAYISAKEEPRPSMKSFDQLVKYYTQGTPPVSDRDVLTGGQGSCGRLREIVWKESPVPSEDVPTDVRLTDFVYTGLFCRIGDRTIVLILKNWEGDSRQTQYQQIVLRMAGSIRIHGQSPT